MSKLNFWRTLCLVFFLCAVSAIASPAQTFKSLVSFNGTDGAYSNAGLVQATDGNLYGTTAGGGAYGYGTVFRMTAGGKLTALYSFCSQTNCTDGEAPSAGLVQATNGGFYGTTAEGGANDNCGYPGCGTVFKITPAGKLTTLYSFCSQTNCTDGALPFAWLVQGTNGNFYGTTAGGGASTACGTYGCGTVFEITPEGTLSTLYNFCSQTNCTDGATPSGGAPGWQLVQATDGNFYGTTWAGGAYGVGTVFKITPQGRLTTLHSFGGTDGEYPNSGVVQATDGNFYGTTARGDTIFKMTPSGTVTTLASVCCWLYAGLVQATDGNLYGTTYVESGAYGYGSVYEVTLGGNVTTLYSFCSQTNCTDGAEPLARLAQDTNGNLYGTTSGYGTYGDGTVFSLSVRLGPFVETVPTSGKVGTKVTILGNNLTSATSVTFNGMAATPFTVNSTGTAITTTVPTGATTGFVKVTTPSHTLTSNVKFRVP